MKTIKATVSTLNSINIVMQDEAQGLNEVVVTAFGIQRKKNILPYAAQQIDGDDVNKTKGGNIALVYQVKYQVYKLSRKCRGWFRECSNSRCKIINWK
jgi:hypothetical protein